MSTSDLKLSLMERLALVQDAGFLQRRSSAVSLRRTRE